MITTRTGPKQGIVARVVLTAAPGATKYPLGGNSETGEDGLQVVPKNGVTTFRMTATVNTVYTGSTLSNGEVDGTVTQDVVVTRYNDDTVGINGGPTGVDEQVEIADGGVAEGSITMFIRPFEDNGSYTGAVFEVQDTRGLGGASAHTATVTMRLERLSETLGGDLSPP